MKRKKVDAPSKAQKDAGRVGPFLLQPAFIFPIYRVGQTLKPKYK